MAYLSRRDREAEEARFLAAFNALWDEWLMVAAYVETEGLDPFAVLCLDESLGLLPVVACHG